MFIFFNFLHFHIYYELTYYIISASKAISRGLTVLYRYLFISFHLFITWLFYYSLLYKLITQPQRNDNKSSTVSFLYFFIGSTLLTAT